MRTRAVRAAALAVCGAVGLLGAGARANGRFPSADYFIAGPGQTNDTLVLRATFGVMVSRDRGLTWGWVCEQGYDIDNQMIDPTASVGAGGAIVLALPRGLRVSTPDACDWSAPPGDPAMSVIDVAQDARGETLVAVVGPNGTSDRVLISRDGGRTWTEGATQPGFFSETIEVAPSDPRRVYVSGFVRGGVPVMLRSDDGGMTLREITRDFAGGQSAYLSAVDPTNPDVVWVRANLGLGTILLKSEDGAMTFRRVAETAEAMRGFAISSDGQTVWYSSIAAGDGIYRSVRGGPFTRLGARVTPRCLRYSGGLLFVCADESVDGYSLGCSRDGGETVDPLFSFADLRGPVEGCGAGTTVGGRCPALWPAQRATLSVFDGGIARGPGHDAGPDVGAVDVVDAGEDAVVDGGARGDAGVVDAAAPMDVGSSDIGASDAGTRDGGGMDVAARVDAGNGGGGGGCDCRAAPSRRGLGARWGWLAAGVVATAVGRSRRRRGR